MRASVLERAPRRFGTAHRAYRQARLSHQKCAVRQLLITGSRTGDFSLEEICLAGEGRFMAFPIATRVAAASFFFVAFLFSAEGATFPLSIPTRPTSFPLQRPILAGEVVVWGAIWNNENHGQLSPPEDLNDVVAVAAKSLHALALHSDGTVVAWGDNRWGQTSVPADLSRVVAIAAGENAAAALKEDGTVVVWGYGATSYLVPPPTAQNLIGIALGGMHAVALRADGPPLFGGKSPLSIRA